MPRNSWPPNAKPAARHCWKKSPCNARRRRRPAPVWRHSFGRMAPSITHGAWPIRCESPPTTGRPPRAPNRIEGHDRGRSMKRKEYEKALRKLQVEQCALEDCGKQQGLRVVVIFEGRYAAGKGGTIKAITERVSPRVFRVVALPAPSDREKSQLYMQRYVPHFPAAGEIVIFDRSWYNRAGVEYVMGFCTPEEHR